ncbi:putative cystine/glutamate transporter [Apostichopus japonicus]|uniref:Putative cystine/glutamate transporter n=1 Tax=Stichopus japonicus TaxID=307972 RepID=A0A2G8KQ02_STIJA|nr:putative cystine/glutamate transporter [Apostichopus japonicus]
MHHIEYKTPVVVGGVLTLLVNGYSTTLATRFQIFYTIAKTVGLIVIIVSGIVMLFGGHTDNFQHPFQPQEPFSLRKLPQAFYAGSFAYSGWSFLIFVVEEVKHPLKTLPLSMNISLATVTIILLVGKYILLNDLDTAGDTDFRCRSCDIFCTCTWVLVLDCLGLCSNLSCWNTNSGVFSRTRMSFAASREGRFPKILSFIHIKHRTPLLAILLPPFVFIPGPDHVSAAVLG